MAYKPPLEKTYLLICESNEDSIQPAHARSLIRVFVECESWMGEMSKGLYVTKTCLYNFDPLKLHFYVVKLGFTGVYIIFLISAQKHKLWVPVRTASFEQKYKKYQNILSEHFHFWVVQFSVYVCRHGFVMSIY